MNFQQLKIIRETVRQGFNLTQVAEVMFTSQPGVSRNIKELEEELGIEIFVRHGKRLLGLTEPGKELISAVDQILADASNLQKIAEQFSNTETGQLTIATTHTQARYALPPLIKWFKTDYPKVHLALQQGSPSEIASLLISGDADIGIATENLKSVPELVTFPFYSWNHAIVVRKDHPLTREKNLTLERIAAFPIITYHEGYTGRAAIDQTFEKAQLVPDIVLSAIDADVIKTYVELELGVGIIASMAYSPEKDRELSLLPADHLFLKSTTVAAVRKGTYLRSYAYALLEKLCPDLGELAMREAIKKSESV
jgi:LysR family cys regulon transcriptional activator